MRGLFVNMAIEMKCIVPKTRNAALIFGLCVSVSLYSGNAWADCTNPPSPEGGLAYFTTDDTYRLCDGNDAWVTLLSGTATSLWTDNTTHITRENFHILDAGLVAGSTTAGLDGDGIRSFYDPDKGAMRGGEVAFGEAGWQDANVGADSFAWGRAPRASGLAAVALGDRTRATGESSLAVGYDSYATNNQSIAMGDTVASNGWGSFAVGVETSATANHSVSFGLGDATGARPTVSAASSFGIFMGDQTGVDLATANTMAILGGDFIVGSYMKGDSGGTHDNRMFFDVSKAAFRAGNHDNVYWDDADVGMASVAFGGAGASGPYSFAVGENSGGTWASGYQSVAFGGWAEGSYAMTFGGRAEAAGSKTFGGAHVTGDGSIGIATETNYPLPIVSSTNAVGIFMGDQNGYDLATANRMALVGGHFMVDDAGATGSQGCIRYDGTNSKLQFSHDCTTYSDLGTASSMAINNLTDAYTDYVTDDNMVIGNEGTTLAASTGTNNLMIGETTGDSLTTGYDNTAAGYDAFTANSTGYENTAFGRAALSASTTGSQNTAIGYQAMSSGDGAYSTAVGFNSMAGGGGAVNTAIGANTLASINNGERNTALGAVSLHNNTDGNYNVAAGESALRENIDGDNNVAIGQAALDKNVDNDESTAIGYQSMRYANDTTTGIVTYNTALGAYALQGSATPANNTGTANTALGHSALSIVTSGANNVALGSQTGDALTTGSGNILIGAGVDAPTATTSDHLNIGGTIYGDLATDRIAIGTDSQTADIQLKVSGTGGIMIPSGTDAQRPATPAGGMLRYNTTAATDKLEYYDAEGTAWVQLGAGGSLWTDNTTHITRGNYHVLDAGETMTTAGFDGVTGVYSLYHTDKAALRIGRAEWGSWNEANIGNYSLAIGNSSFSSGEGSFAGGLNNQAQGDGSIVMGAGSIAGPRSLTVGYDVDNEGWDSYAFGWQMDIHPGAYGVFAVHTDGATTPPQMGTNSDGSVVFLMGAQEAVVMNTGNTLGLFGGKMVIDPADPATQLSARATLDIGASTDSIILPSGTDAQRPATPVGGMLRYNSTATPNDKIEYYDAESAGWLQLGSGSTSLWTDNTTKITRGAFHVINSGQTSDSAALSDAGGVGNATLAFYDTDSGALRGGRVDIDSDADSDTYDNAWDNANIGDYSFAWGKDVRASGGRSVAFGNYTIASGTNSLASGFKTVASSDNSVAFGWGNTSSGAYAIASGVGNTASGAASFVGGNGVLFPSTASGDSSFAYGINNTASAIGSVALGGSSTAAGDYSAAIGAGVNVTAAGDGSIALGLGANGLLPSVISGTRSLGIFMGTDNTATLAAANTVGMFGGKMVIDPAAEPTQLTARATIDAGAGTDAIVVTNGTTAQRPGTPATGMIRYNSTLAKFEAYEGSAWTNMIGAVASVSGAAAPTSIVAGSNSEIQFNNSGVFGASSNFTWNNGSALMTVTGDINYTGTLTDTSDRRLKTDIHPLSERGSMMDRLTKVDTYSFRMKDDKDAETEFGVMAQELEEIFPELVRTADDEMKTKSVNYVGMIAPVIEASKELKAENDLLKAELANLRNDIDGLKLHTGYGFGKASFESLLMIMAGFGMACLLFMVGGFVRKRHG